MMRKHKICCICVWSREFKDMHLLNSYLCLNMTTCWPQADHSQIMNSIWMHHLLGLTDFISVHWGSVMYCTGGGALKTWWAQLRSTSFKHARFILTCYRPIYQQGLWGPKEHVMLCYADMLCYAMCYVMLCHSADSSRHKHKKTELHWSFPPCTFSHRSDYQVRSELLQTNRWW